MNGKQLIKLFNEHGWELGRIRGSHHIMVKEKRRSIPIAVHGNQDLPPGLINAVLKQAGIKKGNQK